MTRIIPIKQKQKVRKKRKDVFNVTYFNNKHKGQRGFVIGGGPSILDIKKDGFNLNLLQKEVTVGVNKAYNLFTPTYLIWTDPYFWKTFRKEILKLRCVKFCPLNVVRKFPNENINDVHFLKRDKNRFKNTITDSFDNPIPMWNNSGVTGLRIAYILGLNPIYLLGIDIQHEDSEGRTHFHTDYEKNRVAKTTPKRYSLFFESFKKTIEALKEKNIKIVSCSKNSKLNDIISFNSITKLF